MIYKFEDDEDIIIGKNILKIEDYVYTEIIKWESKIGVTRSMEEYLSTLEELERNNKDATELYKGYLSYRYVGRVGELYIKKLSDNDEVARVLYGGKNE